MLAIPRFLPSLSTSSLAILIADDGTLLLKVPSGSGKLLRISSEDFNVDVTFDPGLSLKYLRIDDIFFQRATGSARDKIVTNWRIKLWRI